MCDYALELLASLDVRPSAPVYRGGTIRTQIWRKGTTTTLRSIAPERDVIVLDNGCAVLDG